MTGENPKLYVRMMCPYSQKVMKHLKDNNLDIPLMDVAEEEHFSFLKEKGGKTQVPCLICDDLILYESNDIISWLKENM